MPANDVTPYRKWFSDKCNFSQGEASEIQYLETACVMIHNNCARRILNVHLAAVVTKSLRAR